MFFLGLRWITSIKNKNIEKIKLNYIFNAIPSIFFLLICVSIFFFVSFSINICRFNFLNRNYLSFFYSFRLFFFPIICLFHSFLYTFDFKLAPYAPLLPTPFLIFHFYFKLYFTRTFENSI